MGKKYGYVRVSTREQNEDRQLYSMQESGVEKKNIFVDKQSGCSFERPGYLRMMKKLKQMSSICIPSTAWAEITKRSCSNGRSSPKKKE